MPWSRHINAWQQHHKFIATHARHGVFLPNTGLQTLGHLTQQGVTHLVPQRVIDFLEPVQIDKQQAKGFAVA